MASIELSTKRGEDDDADSIIFYLHGGYEDLLSMASVELTAKKAKFLRDQLTIMLEHGQESGGVLEASLEVHMRHCSVRGG